MDNWQLNTAQPYRRCVFATAPIFTTLNTTTPMITMFMHVIYYEHIISLQIYMYTLICIVYSYVLQCGYPFKIWQFNLHKIEVNVGSVSVCVDGRYGSQYIISLCVSIWMCLSKCICRNSNNHFLHAYDEHDPNNKQ